MPSDWDRLQDAKRRALNGLANGGKIVKCRTCGGSGRVETGKPGWLAVATCPDCAGQGEVVQ